MRWRTTLQTTAPQTIPETRYTKPLRTAVSRVAPDLSRSLDDGWPRRRSPGVGATLRVAGSVSRRVKLSGSGRVGALTRGG